ncbi:adhesive plaque matrix protein isoform X1 [Helicoverpa armigera]|uniref:adhesive plaque matrix protein isoform X1 n=1 Tax=Helicoverpa armigera TaxID=29058 RepID=UPI0030832C02
MSPLWILLTLLPVLGSAERFNCKGRILGAYYADAKSGCKAFHVCVRVAGGGIRDFRFFCPPGTLFHQEAQTCTDWGDDDPLACPADIYDGQFDLYRIGSGFDTKKLSSYGNRDDEAEFGLQRAETGDRRLAQNNVAPNRPDSDLRAAHSSDFFSGQRDRGRDEQSSVASSPSPVSSQQPYQRQSFRRPTTQRTYPTTQRTFPPTQYTTPASPPSSQQPAIPPQQYDAHSKRKLVRKRPIYVSTQAPPTTFLPNTAPQQQYSEPPQQNFNRRYNAQNRQTITPPPNVPPQYKQFKDEYVEVPRVTPKQSNRFYPSSAPSTYSQSQSTAAPRFNKKDGLVELYNYDAQSTPGLNVQNENRPFKVRNSFNVADVPRDPEFARAKNFNNYNNRVENNRDNVRDTPTTIDYSVSARTFPTTTPAYKNFNSVSYEPEKNNFVPYSKQAYYNNPSTTVAPTTTYSTARPEPPLNLNTVAYNTNLAFNTQSANFAEDDDEDDGQYHPPQGEDDGQYRPELYDRELLAGAHSLNIAASGNRLPEDRKKSGKTQPPPKPSAQTAAPRPFRPAPSPTAPPTTRAPEVIYTTTPQPQTVNTQRTFDYFQTYTTTSRPADYQALNQNYAPANEVSVGPTTTVAPRVPETRPPRPPSRVPVPPTPPSTPAPRPTTRAPHFANPPHNKEDNSYDYAYYDSDPGFAEYDHIEEFGKTKTRA